MRTRHFVRIRYFFGEIQIQKIRPSLKVRPILFENIWQFLRLWKAETGKSDKQNWYLWPCKRSSRFNDNSSISPNKPRSVLLGSALSQLKQRCFFLAIFSLNFSSRSWRKQEQKTMPIDMIQFVHLSCSSIKLATIIIIYGTIIKHQKDLIALLNIIKDTLVCK